MKTADNHTSNLSKLIVLFSFVTMSVFSNAQSNTKDLSLVAQQLDQEKMNKKDCVLMKNGKMLVMKDGKTMDMSGNVTLNDGSVVSTNGTITMKDGTTKVLKNGDSVDMNGNWERIDKDKPEIKEIKKE